MFIHGIGQGLCNSNLLQAGKQFGKQGFVIGRLLRQPVNDAQQSRTISTGQRVQQLDHLSALDSTEHGTHFRLVHRTTTEGNGLIQQAERIAHAAVRCARQQLQCRTIGVHFFGVQQVLQVTGNQRHRQALEIELQTARQHRSRQLLWIGGGQQELDVRWWFFQRFQQGVETVRRQHVDFVDQVDLVACARRRILDIVQQLAGILYLGAGGGIHFDQVHAAAFVDLHTTRTLTAGFGTDAGFTIQGFGKNTCNGGLAHAARAGKQVSVVQTIVVQRIDQGSQDVLLTHHFGKLARPPFTRQDLITHE